MLSVRRRERDGLDRWYGALVLALAIVGSAMSRPAVSRAAPNAALDQSNPSRALACRYTGWVPDSANEWVAETFAAGLTGSLTDVVLSVRVSNPQNPVAIVPVDAGGRPIASTPLAAATLAVRRGSVSGRRHLLPGTGQGRGGEAVRRRPLRARPQAPGLEGRSRLLDHRPPRQSVCERRVHRRPSVVQQQRDTLRRR